MNSQSYQKAKLIVLYFFLVSILLVLSSCGGGTDNASTDESEADAEKVFHLRMNTINPPAAGGPPTPSTIATDIFADEVREKTNGRVDIEVFYSNQLAGQSESLDALARGTIDLQVITPAAWSDKIPEGNFASLPFAWKSEEELSHLLRETEFGKLYEEALLNYGVKPLHYHYTGSAGYLSNTPITNPSDMKGLVVNAVGTLKGNFYKEMGAGISSVPFADYYEGLLRGTFDAVSFPYYALEVMKLGEVVDYITVPGEIDPSLSLIVISQSTWDKLPTDLQEIIWETAMDIEERTIKASQEYSARGFEYAKEIGVEIVEMTDEGYNEFLDTAKKTYWKGFAETNDRTKKMIEILEASKK
ncbi:TRAP transporter substrate-binding protein [Bacillus dakarensis]|uniref:TRAP transporter substrate-binding protein n=1 Tax=Robertmurraya dakarensis TaxID=1926278 RepID=UPI0009810C5A|nr:TRAP transporter substrate-binding protein [Bacillus dakarensis]